MKAERFHPSHYPIMREWYLRRALTPPTRELLPKNGFIVRGVAAAFLYSTDSDICFFEGLITNCRRALKVRACAIDALYDALNAKAVSLGFKRVLAFTSKHGVNRFLLRHRFAGLGQYRFFTKEIS